MPHIPRLRYRPTTRADLAECLELVPPWLGLDDGLRKALPALWDRLVEEPSMVCGIIEDLALPAGRRIQGWGVTIILPLDIVRKLSFEDRPRAFLARRVYSMLASGELTPMSDRDIGAANARGEVTMFILHFSLREPDVTSAYGQSIVRVANDAFRAFHDGYFARAVYYETAVIIDRVATASGFDRMQYADEAELAALPAEQRPTLFGLTREQAESRMPGTPARNSFERHPPLFAFSASQRRLLWLALFDESDEHLMPLLGVSVHGLKKLWRGIYERIEDRMPEFFGDAGGSDDGRRGPEKRRQVLAYVRQRPEELRPWLPERG